MTTSLYQKYRPQQFADVINQTHVVQTLQNAITDDRVSHAYLFTGSRGLGKTTIARLLARAVNCTERKKDSPEPCGRCQLCQASLAGNALDIIEIDAASHTGVENVRENIIANSRFTPSQARRKVFIIDEVHMLSVAAFNALLKTLEEPPAHVMFILATTEPHKVPETIISRCQRFDFRKVEISLLVERLEKLVKQEKKKVPRSILETIARYSDGGVRDAESRLGQVLAIGGKEITAEQAALVIPQTYIEVVTEILSALAAKDAKTGIELVGRLVDDGADLLHFTAELLEVLRVMLHIRVGQPAAEAATLLTKEQQKQIGELAGQFSLGELTRMIEEFSSRKTELKSSEIIQLPLELAIVNLATVDESSWPNDTDQAAGAADQAEDHGSAPPAEAPPVERELLVAAPALTEPEPAVPATGKILVLDEIKAKWDGVLQEIRQHNHSLASTLRQHRPMEVHADGSVEIRFKYKFHEQRIAEAKNRQILHDVFVKVFGQPIVLRTVIVSPVVKPESEPAEPGVESILKTFGGTLVD